jgi:hypothetical protein
VKRRKMIYRLRRRRGAVVRNAGGMRMKRCSTSLLLKGPWIFRKLRKKLSIWVLEGPGPYLRIRRIAVI